MMVSGAWSEFNTNECEELEIGRRSGCNKVPVGVFEAYVSLLEFTSVLQFGHILNIGGRLGHGLLEKGEQEGQMRKSNTPFKRVTWLLQLLAELHHEPDAYIV